MKEITFEKSAAPFILDAFKGLKRKCKFCGVVVDEKNLGGVVELDGNAALMCGSSLCAMGYADTKICHVCHKPKPCPCGGDRKKYAKAIAKSFMEDLP